MSNLTKKARLFAQAAHEGQVRKYTGKPYFTHCEAVALLVKQKGGSDAMIAAAFLHDTVEDTDVVHDDIWTEFGATVANLVYELTDMYTHEAYPDLNRMMRKKLETARWLTASKDAIAIKVCDLADNTSSIVKHDPQFSITYLREKADMLEAMGFAE